ncbi:predicted protein [Sclerotinia sclerotiorum 1980 UF-70]|uniref:Uncharacterized protein n=1 Tax=Sclerotinia sclerotiorum (strain ATCC 18683 / 1980 / Ss-1) TaxID=665079 RepID=A7EIX6_SCLS1|nr:predicted protein [Sclerotinia sclerotiorum 1980 UF-70]EDO02792.1 predicted protein [Sclerotinia sclerotiorum 1980 UF-70]
MVSFSLLGFLEECDKDTSAGICSAFPLEQEAVIHTDHRNAILSASVREASSCNRKTLDARALAAYMERKPDYPSTICA